MHIASLHIHPLKSGKITNLDEVRLNERGLVNDRTMMVVDRNGVFLTQRDLPPLARIATDLHRGQLHFAQSTTPLDIDWTDRQLTVHIWKTTARTIVATDDVNEILSAWLDHPVMLVMACENSQRLASANWAPEGTSMALQDGYPILIACTASLDALNERIAAGPNGPDAQIPMNRFRPNVVIETTDPWVEDTWRRIRLGDTVLDLLKPCQRCVITTQDQTTGMAANNEPSRTLMTFRRSAHPDQKGLMFAWNTVRVSGDALAVGDEVEILETDPAGWPFRPAR